jgi:hypothetical protein
MNFKMILVILILLSMLTVEYESASMPWLQDNEKNSTVECERAAFEVLFQRFKKLLLKSSFITGFNLGNDTNSSLLIPYEVNNSSCNDRSKRMFTNEEKNLCPSEYYFEHREDKFPTRVRKTRCLCDHCSESFEHDHTSKCLPKFELRPVLQRLNECDADGVWKWEESSEFVNEHCYCGKKYFVKPG